MTFEVQIVPAQSLGLWRPFAWQSMTCRYVTREEAEQRIACEKEIDAKFPVGHYRYRIVEVKAAE